MIAGYMGACAAFDDAIGEFAYGICAPKRAELSAVVTAIKEGRIQATADV